jgi:hypothetical protein
MADFVAGDVTYVEFPNKARAIEGPRSSGRQKVFTVTFGDGAKTIGTSGIPLVKEKLGCSTVVKRLRVLDDGNAVAADGVYWWNANETSPALFGETSAPAAVTLTLEVEGY